MTIVSETCDDIEELGRKPTALERHACDRLSNMRRSITSLRSKLDSAHEELDSIADDFFTLEDKFDDAQSTVASQNREIDRLKYEIEDALIHYNDPATTFLSDEERAIRIHNWCFANGVADGYTVVNETDISEMESRNNFVGRELRQCKDDLETYQADIAKYRRQLDADEEAASSRRVAQEGGNRANESEGPMSFIQITIGTSYCQAGLQINIENVHPQKRISYRVRLIQESLKTGERRVRYDGITLHPGAISKRNCTKLKFDGQQWTQEATLVSARFQ